MQPTVVAPSRLHATRPDRKPRPVAAPVLLDKRQVLETLSISGNGLDALVRAGRFPRPIRLAKRLVRWRAADVLAWAASLPSE
jgi:predicted DNA-binding transcriptional regulator AlpA